MSVCLCVCACVCVLLQNTDYVVWLTPPMEPPSLLGGRMARSNCGMDGHMHIYEECMHAQPYKQNTYGCLRRENHLISHKAKTSTGAMHTHTHTHTHTPARARA